MADTELLTEHFGYPPVSLLDDIINSVNILAERALNSVEQGLLNAPPASLGFKTKPPPGRSASASEPWNPAEAAKNEIEAGTHQLETLLCASIDRNLDKFELFVLRNFLCVQPVDIRDWMRLSHYDGLDFSDIVGPDDDDEDEGRSQGAGRRDVPTLESINELRRKLRESMRLNALLTAERERNARTLHKLQHLILGGNQVKTEDEEEEGEAGGEHNNKNNTTTAAANTKAAAAEAVEKHGSSPFAFLQQKGTLSAAGGSTPLSTTTAFTLSQLQALRALSQSLSSVTPDLTIPLAPDDDDDEDDKKDEHKASGAYNKEEEERKYRNKSWRRQRTEYVEHATRRHLELVHGLELGRDGEVRDGEWQGEGRRLAHGEVEGLEKVVAMLGSSSSSRDATGTAGQGAGGGTRRASTAAAGRGHEEDGEDEDEDEDMDMDMDMDMDEEAPPKTTIKTAKTPSSASASASASASTRPAAGSASASASARKTRQSSAGPAATAATTPSAKSTRIAKPNNTTTPGTAARGSSQKRAPTSASAGSAQRRRTPTGGSSSSSSRKKSLPAERDDSRAQEDEDQAEEEEDLMDLS